MISQNTIGYALRDLLSPSEFVLFSDLIHQECGVKIGDDKRIFLASRLKRRMEELGIPHPGEYYALLRSPGGKVQELPSLLDTLMICETSFFRNAPQFDLLKERILPDLIARKQETGNRVLRVWSAGCSTGQEPYSAVIALLQAIGNSEAWTVRVFASDLSFTALERAQCGIYREDQVKGVEPEYLKRYFVRSSDSYVISERVKRHVIFDYHNLKHDNGLRGLDVILCRNVMIYFDIEEQRRLVERFANSLVPGGYLFLGHAESLQSLSARFVMLHQNKGIAYRLEA